MFPVLFPDSYVYSRKLTNKQFQWLGVKTYYPVKSVKVVKIVNIFYLNKKIIWPLSFFEVKNEKKNATWILSFFLCFFFLPFFLSFFLKKGAILSSPIIQLIWWCIAERVLHKLFLWPIWFVLGLYNLARGHRRYFMWGEERGGVESLLK